MINNSDFFQKNQWVTEEINPLPLLVSPSPDQKDCGQADPCSSDLTCAPQTAIKQMWSVFTAATDSVLELRALWPKGVAGYLNPKFPCFRASEFSSVEDFKESIETTALRLNDEGYNLYAVFNPIRSDFRGPGAVKDVDICHRELLLIDIDRNGDTSCPASNFELREMKSLADQVQGYLTNLQWPKPVVVMSGNGYHLYYSLDKIPNDRISTNLVHKTLRLMADHFDSPTASIDTQVFNASRITKVPGTLMRKGAATDDRPYRIASVLSGSTRATDTAVTIDMLVELNEKLASELKPSEASFLPSEPATAEGPSILQHLLHQRTFTASESTAKFIRILDFLSPDVPRGNGTFFNPSGQPVLDYWLGVVWVGASLNNESVKEAVRTWSMKSQRYDEAGFEEAWRSYNSQHLNPVGMGSLLKFAKTKGWTDSILLPSISQSEDSPYKLLSRTDILSLPLTPWRVKRIFPETGLGAIFGPSASGKSFLAIDLACAIATGETWFGHKTYACPVTYIMLEGEAGLAGRIQAWETGKAKPLPAGFKAITQQFQLTDLANLTDLIEVLPRNSVVFLDTLNRAAPTTDENSSAEMGAVLQAAKNLQRATNGLVIVVHHTGKDASRGMRGHSSLFAALDGAIEVQRNDQKRSWSVAKSKDADDGAVMPFRLNRHVLGNDADGEEISSCTVEPDTAHIFLLREPSGAKQKEALRAMRLAFAESTRFGVAGSTPNTPCLRVDEAKLAIAATLTTDPSNKRMNRAKNLIDRLISGGFLGTGTDPTGDGWVWKL